MSVPNQQLQFLYQEVKIFAMDFRKELGLTYIHSLPTVHIQTPVTSLLDLSVTFNIMCQQ